MFEPAISSWAVSGPLSRVRVDDASGDGLEFAVSEAMARLRRPKIFVSSGSGKTEAMFAALLNHRLLGLRAAVEKQAGWARLAESELDRRTRALAALIGRVARLLHLQAVALRPSQILTAQAPPLVMLVKPLVDAACAPPAIPLHTHEGLAAA